MSSRSPRLTQGDLLPQRSGSTAGEQKHRALCAKLARFEAPGINTLQNERSELVLREALGANVLDVAGNRYIDLVSGFGVCTLGHRPPAVIEAVANQSDRLLHGLGDVYAHPSRIELAERLASLRAGDPSSVYFATGGADAVEIALKTAVLATGRSSILAFDPGYHGLTLGALAVTSRPGFREPFSVHAWQAAGRVDRLPFGCDPQRLRSELATERYAAVIFEPIVGREGVLFPEQGWTAAVLDAASASGTVSIADEIFTGMRRTGPWFAHAPGSDGNHADLICCGKALGGGMPIGAVIGRRRLLDHWRVEGEALHTGTFVAHPLACAAALAVLDELSQPWVDERLERIAAAFGELEQVVSRRGAWQLRGRGALWALEAETRASAHALRSAALEAGLLLLAGGPEGRVVQLVPPLVISNRQLDFAVDVLSTLLAEGGA